MKLKFFAFGSFTVGHVHFPKINQLIKTTKPGFVKADMYRLRCGYPAMIPNLEGPLVEGLLHELEAPESFWSILDQLLGVDGSQPEKGFFQRQTLAVQTDNFSQVPAQVYVLNPKKKTAAHKKITGGHWKRDLLDHPPITESLHQRQKRYIHKLSRSKGRDIVPIKLDLYRELMNLELIVDKGRRLALTPLGKEASYFIEE